MHEKNDRYEDAVDSPGGGESTDEHQLFLAASESTTTTTKTPPPTTTTTNSLNGSQSKSKGHSEPFENVDQVFQSLGKPGRYSIVICCLLTLNNFTISPNHAIGVFIGYSPHHECRPFPPNNATETTPFYNNHVDSKYSANRNGLDNSTTNNATSYAVGIGYEGGLNVTHLQCKAILKANGHEAEVRHCERGQWTYEITEGESSSVTEWNLVCDRAYLANLANTFYYIGVMAGGILFGYISDVFGRKVALLGSLYTTVVVGVAIVLSRDLFAFFALRTIMGVAIQGLQTSTYIRLVEMFTPRHRSIYVTAYTVFWAVALVALGLAAWAIRDWRWIQVAVIGQACVAGLYLWIVPESLRWLISQGKDERASNLACRIARFNKLEPDSRYSTAGGRLVPDSNTGKGKERRASYFDLVRTSQLRRRTILMSYITFATNVGYWGLTYNTTAMVGNKYLNFTLGSVAECTMSVINVFIISRFGKKKALISYFMCGGVCCIAMSCLMTETSSPYVTAVLVISTLGRLTTAGLFVSNDLYMAELFPTVVRNMGVGVCTFMGRIGAVFTPLIFTMGLYTFKHLPLLVFGLVTIAGGLVTFLLPETGKLKLPETLEDVIIVEAPNKEKRNKKEMLIPLDTHDNDQKDWDEKQRNGESVG